MCYDLLRFSLCSSICAMACKLKCCHFMFTCCCLISPPRCTLPHTTNNPHPMLVKQAQSNPTSSLQEARREAHTSAGMCPIDFRKTISGLLQHTTINHSINSINSITKCKTLESNVQFRLAFFWKSACVASPTNGRPFAPNAAENLHNFSFGTFCSS